MRNGKPWQVGRLIAGFTLVELLVVMAILALLMSLALPRYFGSVDRAREQALKQELNVVRRSLDEYYADHGQYPDNLQALVNEHYISKLPWDPIAESNDGWLIIAPELPLTGGVYNLHSSSTLQAADGTTYAEW